MKAITLTDDEADRIVGGQTELRRLISPQPVAVEPAVWAHTEDGHSGPGWYAGLDEYPDVGSLHYLCPFGNAGDLFWAQESWYCDDYRCQEPPYPEPPKWREHGLMYYREDDPLLHFDGDGACPWRPAKTMPEWAARHWLRVVKARPERIDGVWMWVARIALEASA